MKQAIGILVGLAVLLVGCSDTIVSSDPTVFAASKVIGEDGGRSLYAVLDGDSEVPPADPDGSGFAHITLNQGKGEVCWKISVEDIATPTAAHIHRAPAGQNGPVVVPLPPDGTMSWSGCGLADSELIKEIRQSPEAFYVNVHNPEYPGGAVRGQLSK